MKILKVLSVLSLLLCGSAYADDPNAASLDLEGIKAKCRQLTDDPQIQPFTIHVTCREKSYVWKEGTPSSVDLTNLREVGGAIAMKNFTVAYQGGAAPIAATKGACMVLDKYERTIQAVDVELTCDELYAINSVSEFCIPAVENRLLEDPSVVTEVKTQESYNTCGGAANLVNE